MALFHLLQDNVCGNLSPFSDVSLKVEKQSLGSGGKKVRNGQELYISRYEDEESLLIQLKTFPTHLFRNASYIFVTFGVTVLFLSLNGTLAFGPKYIESVYSISVSKASLLVGAVGKKN